MTNTLVISGIDRPQITVTKEAEKQKAELLKSSSKIKAVNDPSSDEAARATVLQLASFRKAVTASYDLVRRPVKDFLDRCKRVADDFGREPGAEEERIKGLRGAYTMEQERERRKKEAEAERLRMEAEEKERQAELARMKASSISQAKADKLEREQAKIEDKIAVVEQAAADTKVLGGSVVLDYELLDVHALYASNPRLVSLTDKRREVLEYLKYQQEKGLTPELPGIRVFEKARVSAR